MDNGISDAEIRVWQANGGSPIEQVIVFLQEEAPRNILLNSDTLEQLQKGRPVLSFKN